MQKTESMRDNGLPSEHKAIWISVESIQKSVFRKSTFYEAGCQHDKPSEMEGLNSTNPVSMNEII